MNPVMRRLMREYKELSGHPVREFRAMPLEDNMFEWHFTIQGPPDSPYAEGLYHGRVLIPTNYPFAPPDVVLCTPNGRFELEKKICLSISSYHPENWRSNWGVSTVLHALRQFMLTPGNSGIGAIEYPVETRKAMAKDSKEFKCAHCGRSCKEDWEIMQASPPATETDINATVPPTPMMTPQNSMGSPQASMNSTGFSPSNNNNSNGPSASASAAAVATATSFPSTPSHKPSAAAAAATAAAEEEEGEAKEISSAITNRPANSNNTSTATPSLNQQQPEQNPPTISPLTVGKPAVGGTSSDEENNNNNSKKNVSVEADETNTMMGEKETSVAAMPTPQISTEGVNTVVEEQEKEKNKEEPVVAPAPAPPVAAQQPQEPPAVAAAAAQPLNFNLPPPRPGGVPGNQRAAALRRNHIQQRNNQHIPFIRRDANGRLEIQFSLALLDKLVAMAAIFLACVTAYKMAVLFADPETVAGRIFDSVVTMGLDLVE